MRFIHSWRRKLIHAILLSEWKLSSYIGIQEKNTIFLIRIQIHFINKHSNKGIISFIFKIELANRKHFIGNEDINSLWKRFTLLSLHRHLKQNYSCLFVDHKWYIYIIAKGKQH